MLSICRPTLEATLVAMCNGEGALLHGQLVKFGELLKHGSKNVESEQTSNEGGKIQRTVLKLKFCNDFPFVSGYGDNGRKNMKWHMKLMI